MIVKCNDIHRQYNVITSWNVMIHYEIEWYSKLFPDSFFLTCVICDFNFCSPAMQIVISFIKRFTLYWFLHNIWIVAL